MGNAARTKTAANTYQWNNEVLYDSLIEVVYSSDGSSMYLQPRYVKYPRPLTNLNAVGSALVLNISDGSANSRESILLLGKVSCGKVGARVLGYGDSRTGQLKPAKNADYIPCDPAIQGPWLARPSISKPTPSSGPFLPVRVSGVLWEVSDYNKFLATLGEIVTKNKGEIKTAIVDQIPYQLYSPNYAVAANRAAARAKYILAKQFYNQKLAQLQAGNTGSCKAALDAWVDLTAKAAAAGIQDPVVDRPPTCS